ncbi:CAP domain-containing protein [Peterkaempfera bronchialis]|uniref:CAP domain-containing protein n=1 Tax=Peterkaempfera bronchialis TaxID=2126346 RepID=UPI003C2ED04E
MPSSQPSSAIVAADPASARTAAADLGTAPGGSRAAQAPTGAEASAPAAPPVRPSEAAGRGQERPPAPSVTPSTPTPPASASPVAAPRTEAPPAAPAPVPTTAAPAAPTVSATGSSSRVGDTRATVAAAVLTLVNQERSRAGCGPLVADAGLAALATDFSDSMAARGFFDHTDPDGKSPWDRATAVGISYLGGENIARGQQTPEEVMDAWMNSPGHRANILNCDYKRLGVGVHEGPGGPWWTQDFGF